MQRPQFQSDNYIKIPLEIWEALQRVRISGESRQCLDVICRKTYGFHKSSDYISLSQFSYATGIVDSHIPRALKRLLDMRIIKKIDGNYSINSETTEWQELPKLVTQKRVTKNGNEVTKNGNQKLPKLVDTKENTKETYTKETYTKETSTLKKPPEFLPDSFEIQASKFLYEKCKEKNPFIKEPNFQKWAKEIDLMKRIDKIEESYIMRMIEWAKGNERFWSRNILSTASLRRHFAAMYEEARSEYENRKVYKL